MQPISDNQKQFMPEVQGLRGVAVSIVVLFHIWPELVPGGYVGVDVFFVISGYLITGLLLKEMDLTGRVSLAAFYARRANRLLPAATAVLFLVALCSFRLPASIWADTADQILASAFYFQNWWLADQALNYFSAEDAPGPLQHFWSLSVEEQFYFVWPLVFLAVGRCAKGSRRSHTDWLRIFVVTLGLVSFGYSVHLSHSSPSTAFFATTTRAWELALGGGLAIFPAWRSFSAAMKRGLGSAGLGGILVACLSFSETTIFPGYAALLPTVGAAMVLVSGAPERGFSISSLLGARVLQYLGGISYSLYLWHWPILIFELARLNRSLRIEEALLVLLGSLLAAHLSKALIEDPFRHPARGFRRHKRTLGMAAICLVLSVLSVQGVRYRVAEELAVDPSDLQASRSGHAPLSEFRRAALMARGDVPETYRLGCYANMQTPEVLKCEFGNPEASVRIALVGDSHAAQWSPALRAIAEKNGLHLSVYSKMACTLSDLTVTTGMNQVPYTSCDDWRENLLSELQRTRPDLVIVSQSRAYRLINSQERGAERANRLASRLVVTLSKMRGEGLSVVAIADTPRIGVDIPNCLSGVGYKPGDCDQASAPLMASLDPVKIAGEQDSTVTVIDMNDHVCGASHCPAMLGGLVVWRDKHHLTASFSASLASDLERALRPYIGQADSVAHR